MTTTVIVGSDGVYMGNWSEYGQEKIPQMIEQIQAKDQEAFHKASKAELDRINEVIIKALEELDAFGSHNQIYFRSRNPANNINMRAFRYVAMKYGLKVVIKNRTERESDIYMGNIYYDVVTCELSL